MAQKRHANTGSFRPGDPRAGRPAGRQNKATAEIRTIARGLLTDPAYRKRFAERLKAGKLPPALEALMHYYAYGKPRETVTVGEEPIDIRVIYEDAKTTLARKLDRLAQQAEHTEGQQR